MGVNLPTELKPLLEASAYDHACDAIELVETHISWVLLTGEFAYKIKKPVRFAFVDFSTLERREHFCREELRCNRPFAPSLYLEVVAVRPGGVGVRIAEDDADAGDVIEWAVKMRQFRPDAQLDRLLARGALDAVLLERFGTDLAEQHGALPGRVLGSQELNARVLQPVLDNFDDLAGRAVIAPQRELLRSVRRASDEQARRHHDLLERRLAEGWIRECHGDLHLSNMVLLNAGVAAFDCLEFNEDLRWIDPQSDVAFLFMDCLVRHRGDLAYAFVDGYLNASGDYDGVTLLPFYAAYRSMVRAKVAALRSEQADADERAELVARMLDHVRWTGRYLGRAPGRLFLMCGLSGSGKSYLAQRLAPRLPALRLRSDVARKAQAALAPGESAAAGVGEGLYAADRSAAVYGWLARVAEDLLISGEQVIVDATFLDGARREAFLQRARNLGCDAAVIHCDAQPAILEARIRARGARGDDPSDADLDVLAAQRRAFEPPDGDTIRVDTGATLDEPTLDALVMQLRGGVEA